MESQVCNSHSNLIRSIDNNIAFFEKANKSLSSNLHKLRIISEKVARANAEIEVFAKLYDFDDETPGNGYRSFLDISGSAVKKSTKVCSQLIGARQNIFFRADNYARELDEWTLIFESLFKICEALIELHRSKADGNLFLDAVGYESILTETVKVVDEKAFYGKNIGFQFCASIRPMIKIIVTAMASYYNFYFKDKSKPVRIIHFSNEFTKYFLFPDKRATKYTRACENSTTEFCRSFWFLQEGRIVHTMPRIMAHRVAVNKVFKIHPKPLEIFSEKFDRMVNIPLPSSHTGSAPVLCRLISSKMREGMFGAKASTTATAPSKHLLFHVHGGGWASQTSKSHEIYLREWVTILDVPMLSVDYSLCPDAPFPRAVEEVFYAYCWALKHASFIGWTGESVVFIGDSAGGNLNTSCVVQCIDRGIQKPNGLFTIYTPFWIGFSVTPARFMTIIDPILPYGFLTRLCKSYSELVDETEHKEKIQARKSSKQKLRNSFASNEEEFNVEIHKSPLISPYLASDETLSEFPTTKILTTNLDPCLDDGIEFAKRLRKVKVDVQVDVISGLAHGFLYWIQTSKECHDASMICVERIKSLLDL